MGISLFQSRILQNCVNRYVNNLGGKLYSPSLKGVAWLERAQLIFLIFHTFDCKFGRVEVTADKPRMQVPYPCQHALHQV